MEISTLSEKRGIRSFYDGERYVITSDYYGVVAVSDNIDRTEDSVTIGLDICEWVGDWALKPIIEKGITKLERRFKENKTVMIGYNEVKGQQMSLRKIMKIELIDY